MNVLLLIAGCIGVGAAVFGPSELSRDCPFCRGRGCDRCSWSGEIDDRGIDAGNGVL